MKTAKALLLIGSPRGLKSSSFALGSALATRLADRGLSIETLTVGSALRSEEAIGSMQAAVEAADILLVAFPLYVDELPAPLIRAAELIAAVRALTRPEKDQRLAVIVQCGFPEAHQNRPAVAIMRRFAKEAGFVWAGGLAMGQGGAVDGRPLDKAGGMLRHVTKALELAADALAGGGAIPDEAANLMDRPVMPKWMYKVMANFGWRQQAAKHGTKGRLYARPLAD
jgi:NAD(P)H-dependent FMN reductase